MECQRCHCKMTSHIMSRFNTDVICMECHRREQAHPMYKEAVEAELNEVKRGNYNYAGIGKPSDL